MKFRELSIKGVFAIDLNVKEDNRGGFARTFCKDEFRQIGHEREFVQFNHSWNRLKGTVRGMHFQKPPFKEVKLIRCIRGAIFDVVVDIRRSSPTFLKHEAIELSEDNRVMLYIPEGFAHGFQTLEDDSQLLYHHTEYYRPGFEAGLNYLDPRLNIRWPLTATEMSGRDREHTMTDDTFKGID